MDAAVHACCDGGPDNVPPQSPEIGLDYICGRNPTAAWEGKPDSVACYTTNGWRFIAPFDGLELFDRSSGRNWRFSSGTRSFGIVKASEIHVNGVKILGDQRPSISDAHGGTTVDAEARDILAQILSALRSHGIIAQPG